MEAIATKVGALPSPPCLAWTIQGTCAGWNFSTVETIPSTSVTLTCVICEPGSSAPGC